MITIQWLAAADCSCWLAKDVGDHRQKRRTNKAPVTLLAVFIVSCLLSSNCRCDQVPDGQRDLIANTSVTGQDHLSSDALDDGERSFRSRRHCPSCTGNEQQQQHRPVEQQQAAGDSARLETIKRQILVKLGLNAKPNLLSTMPPRDFILETLLRAEESTVAAAPVRPSRKEHQHHSSASADAMENSVEDDFYGKTSEIIAFGEPGPRLNGQVLAEFSRVQETTPEPSLRVKSATLWLYVQIKSSPVGGSGNSFVSSPSQPKSRHQHRRFHQQTAATDRKSPTLYVFRLLSHQQPYNNTNLSLDKNWNELLASQRVTIQHSGWMNINITEGVQKWFSTSSSGSSKLRLLVDCSGCGSSVQPVLFSTSSANGTRHKKNKKNKRRRRRRRRRLVIDNENSDDSDEEELADEPDDGGGQQKLKQHRPFIVIHTDSVSSRRLRRRTPLDCSPTTSACCKQRFFVSFRSLGWDDWIIAPSGYYANYCRGECGGGLNGPSRTPDTFLSYHSHVIDQVRKSAGPGSSSTLLPFFSANQQQDVEQRRLMMQQHQQQHQLYASLQPCCAPTKFSSMSLIYFGPDMNIIKRDLPKMVVDECGCP